MFLNNGWKLWLLLALKWLQLFLSGENVVDKCKKNEETLTSIWNAFFEATYILWFTSDETILSDIQAI